MGKSYTGNPEVDALFKNTSTLGQQATKQVNLGKQQSDANYLSDQWARVDKARAIKGQPSLPKPPYK